MSFKGTKYLGSISKFIQINTITQNVLPMLSQRNIMSQQEYVIYVDQVYLTHLLI